MKIVLIPAKPNSADTEEMAQIVPSHLGLHCLFMSLFKKGLIVSITFYKPFPIKTYVFPIKI